MSKDIKSQSASGSASEPSAKFKDDSFRKISKLQNEASRFYFQRLNEYAKLPEQLLKCKRTKDFYSLQTEFILKLIKNYREEAFVVSEMLLEMSYPSTVNNSDQKTHISEGARIKADYDADKIIELAKQHTEEIFEEADTSAERTKKRNKRKRKVA